MNAGNLPPWYWKGDHIHLMRNVFCHMRTADPIMRRLLKGGAGDLGGDLSVPLSNMLDM